MSSKQLVVKLFSQIKRKQHTSCLKTRAEGLNWIIKNKNKNPNQTNTLKDQRSFSKPHSKENSFNSIPGLAGRRQSRAGASEPAGANGLTWQCTEGERASAGKGIYKVSGKPEAGPPRCSYLAVGPDQLVTAKYFEEQNQESGRSGLQTGIAPDLACSCQRWPQEVTINNVKSIPRKGSVRLNVE